MDEDHPLPVRQMQVDEGDVGLGQERARLRHRAGLADDGDVRLPQQHEGQGLPEREVVVDQHHPDLGSMPSLRDASRWGGELALACHRSPLASPPDSPAPFPWRPPRRGRRPAPPVAPSVRSRSLDRRGQCRLCCCSAQVMPSTTTGTGSDDRED